NEPGGTTSGQVKLQNIEFSGKTGTAQVMGYDLRNRLGKQHTVKENGWFVGYAPRRNPEIVVAALVQGGGWGSTSAAPVVRDVVKAYYDKKNGNFHPPSVADKTAPQEPVQPLVASAGSQHP